MSHCRRNRSIACFLLLALCLSSIWTAPAHAFDKQVVAKLKKPVNIASEDITLLDAIGTISDQIGMPISVDWPALEKVGIEKTLDVPTTLKAVEAGTALDLVLNHASAATFQDDRADYTLIDGVLTVSTRRKVNKATKPGEYSLKKYLAKARDQDAKLEMVDFFVEMISLNIDRPDPWLDEDFTIRHNKGDLVINTTPKNHLAIKALFDQLGKPVRKASDLESKENRATEARLNKKISVKEDTYSFGQIIDMVRESTGANLAVNWLSLELVGMDRDALIELKSAKMSNAELLEKTFEVLNADAAQPSDRAGYLLLDGIVYIATHNERKNQTQTQVYNLGRVGSDPEKVGQIIDAISARVGDEDDWLNDDSTIINLQGLLVVKTTLENHQAIYDLLKKL